MTPLLAPTDPAWVARHAADWRALLLDHAHCEKKAAATATKLLFMYPHHGFLQRPLSRVAREELEHFEQVLEVLEARGVAFRSQTPSPYMGGLMALARRREPERLVDRLLCCSLIEARSCERFRLLAKRHPDAGLRDLYTGLVASEARHHRLYVRLAERLLDAAAVRARLVELAAAEAAALAAAPRVARLHAA